MLLISLITAAGFALGMTVPNRAHAWAFLISASLLFCTLVLSNAFLIGFVGPGLADNLAYFDGSLTSYLGYNVQISYRVFSLPLVALAVPFVYRLRR